MLYACPAGSEFYSLNKITLLCLKKGVMVIKCKYLENFAVHEEDKF